MKARPNEAVQMQVNFFSPGSVYDSLISQPLIQLSDFNSLIALSQKHKAPIFDLSDDQIGQSGVVLANTKASMQRFRDLFAELAERIIMLTGNTDSY